MLRLKNEKLKTYLATTEPQIYVCSEKHRDVNYFIRKSQNYGEANIAIFL